MIRSIEVLNFRGLRHVKVDLARFQVLVGPNASGKSTLFDALHLIRDALSVGLEGAIQGDSRHDVPHRASDPRDLTWMRGGGNIEIAVTADLPDHVRGRLARSNGGYSWCRYEIAIDTAGPLRFANETFWICDESSRPPVAEPPQLDLFPHAAMPPATIVVPVRKRAPRGWRKVVNKVGETGNDYFYSETSKWNAPFRVGGARSALGGLIQDEEKFPASVWFRGLLMEGVQRLRLDAEAMRLPSPPSSPRTFVADGSNLPWVVNELGQRHPETLREWMGHLRTALPDFDEVRTVDRPEDRSRYLSLRYRSGLEAPSWLVSDGTLRLLALTLLAYLPAPGGIVLIEEPENGIHPRAVESVYQSLSSVRERQVFCATHSTVMLSLASPEELLCFAKTGAGEVDIVPGDRHPRLRDWRGAITLGDLFAAGVLG